MMEDQERKYPQVENPYSVKMAELPEKGLAKSYGARHRGSARSCHTAFRMCWPSVRDIEHSPFSCQRPVTGIHCLHPVVGS